MDVHYSQGPLDRKGNCRGLVRVCGPSVVQVLTIRAARMTGGGGKDMVMDVDMVVMGDTLGCNQIPKRL